MIDAEEHFDSMAYLVEESEVFFAAMTPLTPDELHDYIKAQYGFTIPRVAVCQGHTSPFAALCDAYFNVYLDMIWVGPRTGGKTLQFAILDHLLMKHFATTIANVGAIEEQAKKCYSYITDILNKPQFRDDVRGESLISSTTLKNGARVEILPATMNRVNSPHPERAHWDEIEMTEWKILQEGLSMPVRTNGRPPATIYTSSRKKAYGPMERLLEEAVNRDLHVYVWCVFEVIENCPPERHQNGAKSGCGSCELEPVCRESYEYPDGTTGYEQGPGKAARAHGWMLIDDVIRKFKSMDRGVFDAQWLSKQPETGGLAYPMFNERVHVIDYEYNSAFPVVCGTDHGYANPSVALYAQPTPSGDIVIFAEDYEALRTADRMAESMKKEPWFKNTSWRVSDSAAAGDRATLKNYGVDNEPSDKTTQVMNQDNFSGSISLVRWLLKPQGRRPILYFSRRVQNTIREIKKYHRPDAKEDRNEDERPVKSDDHAMDAMRYIMVRLFRGNLNVG